MSDSQWMYHLTNTSLAPKIKIAGMSSALSRIGRPVANPLGAFAQDRNQKFDDQVALKLAYYLAELMLEGYSLELIEATQGIYTPFTIYPKGNNALDRSVLDQEEGVRKKLYRANLPKIQTKSKIKGTPTSIARSAPVTSKAKDLIRQKKGHFLVRLAVQREAYRYKIEETITASHVYFLKPECAVDGYKAYKGHLHSNSIVVFRVFRASVPKIEDDPSEGKALMTPNIVPPKDIEIMVNHDNFVHLEYRCDDKNWQPLLQWEPVVVSAPVNLVQPPLPMRPSHVPAPPLPMRPSQERIDSFLERQKHA